ncbi:Hypothetical predicted protein [Mytilus galloprovincialis]|uniref:DZIP3-like HEPN domain-containing protein n=1 Tax=Mytilus galloprovincialis TaxID=29158 RepID=A0A8B6DC23_MYTGA|nr:Hypothetical predicted protein [Mytilus galloprovincialis]
MSAASKERQARLGNIVKMLFPKVMQNILKECVSPRGLQGKYELKHITIDFTEIELTLMEKLPNINDFTIELCYKILRYENVFREPSCKWGNIPHDIEVEIGDDVQRILNATNDVISRKSEEISEQYYEEFQKRTQEVLKRVDKFLCQNTSIQLYRIIQRSDINVTDILQELAQMNQINVIQTVDEDSENIERYSRVSRIIIDTFPNILRDIIGSTISAKKLFQMCLPHLNSFSSEQKIILTDLPSSNLYDSMDITLIYKILREFSLIGPPTKGWGSNPEKEDMKLADDVERIRRYRNQLAHRCSIAIEKDEFDDYFDSFRDIGNRIDLMFFHKTNYERVIIANKTCSMDMQMQTKYKNALKQLENIKFQFENKPIKFYWGESFDKSLRNLRSLLKDEKSEGRRTVRLKIIFQNEKDVEKTIGILNSLKDEINKDLSGIEFIVATKGSIVLHIDILPQMLETDLLFQYTLNLFLRRILKLITTADTESMNMVLLSAKEFTQWIASKTIEQQVYLEFNIEAEIFETDLRMVDQLGQISDTILKLSNESGTNNDISATLLPICLEDMSANKEPSTLPLSTNDGTDVHHFPLSYKPYCITDVDSNTVAVSCIDRTILIINISTRSITSTINTRGYCDGGISYNDNNLYVVIARSIIHVMDLKGKVIRTIALPADKIRDISVNRGRLVVINVTSIYCCSLHEQLIWKFKNDKYKDLDRVTTDNESNVYVTDGSTHTVVVVSDDGKLYREILTQSDGLKRPSGIHFDKNENVLLVCNHTFGNGFLFELKRNQQKYS